MTRKCLTWIRFFGWAFNILSISHTHWIRKWRVDVVNLSPTLFFSCWWDYLYLWLFSIRCKLRFIILRFYSVWDKCVEDKFAIRYCTPIEFRLQVKLASVMDVYFKRYWLGVMRINMNLQKSSSKWTNGHVRKTYSCAMNQFCFMQPNCVYLQ